MLFHFNEQTLKYSAIKQKVLHYYLWQWTPDASLHLCMVIDEMQESKDGWDRSNGQSG